MFRVSYSAAYSRLVLQIALRGHALEGGGVTSEGGSYILVNKDSLVDAYRETGLCGNGIDIEPVAGCPYDVTIHFPTQEVTLAFQQWLVKEGLARFNAGRALSGASRVVVGPFEKGQTWATICENDVPEPVSGQEPNPAGVVSDS
jgi:hypothetical protein